nr:putative capsid protein [Crucivirus sp.]
MPRYSTRRAPVRRRAPARRRAPVRRRAPIRNRVTEVYDDSPAPIVVYNKTSRRAQTGGTESSNGSLGRSLLSGGLGALGGAAFGPVGRGIGSLVGGGLSSLLGFGAYQVKSNVFMDGKLPRVTNDPQGGGTIIRFQEYLGDVITSATANTFSLNSYLINAANPACFPWLSQIAENYEQYSFEGLLFEFKTTSADALNSTNTALGTVMFSTNYDSFDSNFASKGEMLNYEYSTSCKPSHDVMHMIECSPRQNVLSELYTLNGAVPSGADPRLYHLGNFQVATTGFQGTSVNCGMLYCTYQVRLMKPKLFSTLGLANNIAHYTLSAASAAAPLGTVASATKNVDSIGLTLTSSTVLTFPQSQIREYFMVYVTALGNSTATLTAPLLTFSGLTQVSLGGLSASGSSPAQTPTTSDTGARLTYTQICYTNGGGVIPTITFGVAGTYPAAVSASHIYVMQIPSSII